jgi:4-amino-4-deoxy-L-arabinose transferase-like glycosyltransferase
MHDRGGRTIAGRRTAGAHRLRRLPGRRPGGRLATWGLFIAVAASTLGVGLGSSRLSYHEAIVAQVGRELLAHGDWLVPTLDGRPWLEKPPLAPWLVAGLGWIAGGVDETVARLPSALAAALLAAGVAVLAGRLFGTTIGRLAGLVQLTTLWTVRHGRLAEADILLACLVTWGLASLERIRSSPRPSPALREMPFLLLLGTTSLAKGLGFGGALMLAAVGMLLAWDRDRATFRKLLSPVGLVLAALIALAWPLRVLARYPEALDLWSLHTAGRFAARPGHFASEPFGLYVLAPLWQVLPWTPLAIAGAWRSWRRAKVERFGPDRLLWAWAAAPAVLVTIASVRNAHYLIYALPPLSIWAALGLARIGERLAARGWDEPRLRRAAVVLFAAIGLGCAFGFAWAAPRLDRRGVEWGWYAEAARRLEPGEPLVLLYDDWDRDPYPTPFGPFPHDLAVRRFYLDRPNVTWHRGPESLKAPAPRFAVIARDRDVPALRRLGRVEELARGPAGRWDRTYLLLRITPAR